MRTGTLCRKKRRKNACRQFANSPQFRYNLTSRRRWRMEPSGALQAVRFWAFSMSEINPPLDRIEDLQIERELQDSYLTYAMSTIMDRALPDVRDGLKPSQRRILVAMNDLNLLPGRKAVKCAKIAGDKIGRASCRERV